MCHYDKAAFGYNDVPDDKLEECGFFLPKEIPTSLSVLSGKSIDIAHSIHDLSHMVIDSETNDIRHVFYYTGAFGSFHEGHMDVVRRTYERAITEGYDPNQFLIVISPSNSDYTKKKYGNSNYASNKYRYERIMDWEEQLRDLNVVIDLAPMLDMRCDHNFTTLIEMFCHRLAVYTLRKVHTKVLVSGKDRDYSAISDYTNYGYWFFDAEINVSTSDNHPVELEKKHLLLRCDNHFQLEVFSRYLGQYYLSVTPIYLSDELELTEKLIEKYKQQGNKVISTICRAYRTLQGIDYWYSFSRYYTNPLTNPSRSIVANSNGSEMVMGSDVIIDSDIFSGGTKRDIETIAQCHDTNIEFVATYDLSNDDDMELLDIWDFINAEYVYPRVDVTSRCSLPVFDFELHNTYNAMINELKCFR